MKIIKTNLAMKVTNRSGICIAATMLYSGIEIDADFMDTVAKTINDNGKIEIVNVDENPIKIGGK